MLKLSLINHPDTANNTEDSCILPIYFSTNYITLLPDESIDVQVSTVDVEMLCSNGYAMASKNPGSYLMLSFDGWNAQEGTAQISCDMR